VQDFVHQQYYREFENTLIDLIDSAGFFLRCRPMWFDLDSGWAREIMTCHIHSFDGRIPGRMYKNPVKSGDKLPITYKGFSDPFHQKWRFQWRNVQSSLLRPADDRPKQTILCLVCFRWGLHKNAREQLGNVHFWMIKNQNVYWSY